MNIIFIWFFIYKKKFIFIEFIPLFFYLIYLNKIFSNTIGIITIIFIFKFREIYIKYKILKNPRLLKINYIMK